MDELKNFFDFDFDNSFTYAMLNTFLLSKENDIKWVMYKNVEFNNFELFYDDLIKNENWVYVYYVPIQKKNLILLGFFKNIPDLFYFKKKKIYNNPFIIIKNFNTVVYQVNFKNQICRWKNQSLFSEIIDLFFDGNVFDMPDNWGQPINKFVNINNKSVLKYNNLEDLIFFFKKKNNK